MKLILHGHHAANVISVLSSLKERIKEIKARKPKEEHETRLRLIRELTKDKIDLLPKNVIATFAECNRADAEWKRADAEWKRADAEWKRAYDEWKRAYADYDRAYADYNYNRAYAARKRADAELSLAIGNNEPALIDWHKKACGCPFYENGKNIFSKE